MAEEREVVNKVTFGFESDFKFAAAYEAYSSVFDEISGFEDRQMLNDLISQLFNKEITYSHFYREINRFRDEPAPRKFVRTRIEGQRKRAYRRSEQKKDRLKRHRR